MQNTDSKRFIFSAYANSVSAVIHEPVKAFLSDAPCAAIPVTGGLISQSRENISFRIESQEVLRVGRASATVLAERRKDHYVTLATSTVENLNILDVITADAVVSRITSVYPADNQGTGLRQSRFYFAGPHFHNLKIGGELIDATMLERPTDDKTGDDKGGDDKGGDDKRGNSKDGFLISDLGFSHGSLFSKKFRDIPQFGTIHIGKFDVLYNAKIVLTMLRVELGCPVVATIAAATASTNGTDI